MNLVEQIKRVYSQDSTGEFNFKENSNGHSLESLFNSLSHTDIENVMELDFSKKKGKIIELLRYIPAELLLKEFGEEMVCWKYLNASEISSDHYKLERMVIDSPRHEELLDTFLGLKRFTENRTDYFLREMGSFLKGKEGVAMTKAISIANTFDCLEKCTFTQKTYFLIEGLLYHQIVPQIDLKQLLNNHSYPKMSKMKNKLDNYSLESLFAEIGFEGSDQKWIDVESRNRGMVFQIYLDAPLGIILKYNEEPQAVVAFSPINRDVLQIYQLQGVVPKKFDDEGNVLIRGSSRGLSSYDWQVLLIDVVVDLAKRYNFKRIAIQSGYNNSWSKHNENGDLPHLPLELALQKYDAVAARLGFTQREDKNWYKAI
jgi:hypothetical protein